MKSGRIGTGNVPPPFFKKKKGSRPQHGRVRRGREIMKSHPFFLMNEFPLTKLVVFKPLAFVLDFLSIMEKTSPQVNSDKK
jgi:hypothetical protein